MVMASACAGEEDGPLPTNTVPSSATGTATPSATSTETPVNALQDLGSVDELRAAFLQDEGSTRLVLLVPPT